MRKAKKCKLGVKCIEMETVVDQARVPPLRGRRAENRAGEKDGPLRSG